MSRRKPNDLSEKPSLIATAIRKFSLLTGAAIVAVFGFIWLVKYQLTPSFYSDVYDRVETSFRAHESALVTAFLQNDPKKAQLVIEDQDFLPEAKKEIVVRSQGSVTLENCLGTTENLSWGQICRGNDSLRGVIPVRSADQLLGWLKVEVPAQLSEWTPYKRLHQAIVISAVLIIFLTFIFLTRFLRSTLIPVRKAIKMLEKADDTEALKDVGANLPFQELVGLTTKLVKRSDELNKTKHQLEEAKRKEQLSAVATQVAHDLRSPVLALTALSKEVDKLSKEDLVRSIETSARRIDQISRDILEKCEVRPVSNFKGYTFIYPVMQAIVAETKLVTPAITVSLDLSEHDQYLGLNIPEADFGRIFANLLSNATSAVTRKGHGEVHVSVRSSATMLEIIVRDSGQGMTDEVLKTVLEKGGTFNTPNGHGLGLSYVKSSIGQYQGGLRIESAWMKGTTVFLSFPLSSTPSWLVSDLSLSSNSKIVVVDDDISILDLWKQKLSDSKISAELLTRPPEKLDADLLIIDQEIRGNAETGLQYIERNQIASKSVLSTGHYSDEIIQRDVGRIGSKLLPKFLLPQLELNFSTGASEVDLVLIDDDIVTRQSWELVAKIRGKKIAVFESHEDFLRRQMHLSIPIYIDDNLEKGVRGSRLVHELKKYGYRSVTLISGGSLPGHSLDSKEFPLLTSGH